MFFWRTSITVRQAVFIGRKHHLRASFRAPYSVLYERRAEDVTVRCGSSGEITLNIYNHSDSSFSSPRPIILYFPPLLVSSKPHTPPLALLSDDTTLVQINPRWSSSHAFPTPVHDTLFAYDWILQNLLPPASASAFPRTRMPPTPIGIYGSFLGGSLATSLALTESYKKRPNERSCISALAVSNSIFDWSTLASAITQKSEPPVSDSASSSKSQEEKTLSSLLPTLFTNPAQAFDPFASPILFFRTSGLSIPRSWNTSTKTNPPSPTTSTISPSPSESAESQTPSSQPLSSPPPWADLEFDPEFDPPSTFPEFDPDDPSFQQTREREQQELPVYPPSRKAHLRFPAAASSLVLPRTLLHVGGQEGLRGLDGSALGNTEGGIGEMDGLSAIMEAQAKEFAGLIRRSVRLHEMKTRALWDEDLDVDAEAEARAAVVEDSDGGDGEGEWVREWLVERGVLV